MRVDIVDLRWEKLGCREYLLQQVLQRGAVRWQRGHMIGIAVRCEGHNLSVDVCTSCNGLGALFQQYDTGSLCHDKAIAALIVGSRGACRLLVITCTQGSHHAEGIHHSVANSGVGSTSKHAVRSPLLDRQKAFPMASAPAGQPVPITIRGPCR